jgi:carboxyl-terminal processing protease
VIPRNLPSFAQPLRSLRGTRARPRPSLSRRREAARPGWLRWAALALAVWLAALGPAAAAQVAPRSRPAEPPVNIETLVEVLGLILKHSPQTGSPAGFLQKVLERILRDLGPYNRFLSRDEFLAFQRSLSGQYQGIGVEMVRRPGGIFVRRVELGSPADKAGLRRGDRIVSVGGRQVVQDLSLAGKLLRGPAGSQVQVAWEDNRGRTRRAAIRRTRIVRHDVDYFVSRDVLVLNIRYFKPQTDERVRTILSRFAAGRRLLLDLRDNQGGDLQAAVNVADWLSPPGVELIRITYRHGEQRYLSRHRPLVGRYPVYILVNRDTASAAELLAAALRYRRLAYLIGSRTRGKGVVTEVFPLLQGHGLLLTVGVIRTPDGATYNRRGLRVDLAIGEGDVTSGGDLDGVLERALQWLGRTGPSPAPSDLRPRRIQPLKSVR